MTRDEAVNWPKKPTGWLVIEDHSEDGSWSGHAYSYDPRGQSVHAEGAVPISLQSPKDTIEVPREVWEKAKTALEVISENGIIAGVNADTRVARLALEAIKSVEGK